MKKTILILVGILLLFTPVQTEAREFSDMANAGGNCGGHHNPRSQFSTDLGRESNISNIDFLDSEEDEKYPLDAKLTGVKVYKQTSITKAIIKTLTDRIEKILTFLNN